MKTKLIFSAVLLLLVIIGFKTLPNINSQKASVVSSTKIENIYNISPSKEIPGMYNFDYAFDKVTTNLKKGEALFDAPIAQFDDELARKVLEKEYGILNADFGPVRDSWNYPVKPNAFMKDYKKDENKKQSFLDSLKLNKALAYDVDNSNEAIYNCRANPSIAGYFKAYFEDIELGNGIGYDDPNYGEGRREEACRVLEDISEMLMIDSTVISTRLDIIFTRSDTPMPPNALAGASSYFGPYTPSSDNGILHSHIITGYDPTPATGNFDALIITNFADTIQWDVDLNLNSSTYDMYSVLYHEVLHALGFRGLLPAATPETGVSQRHGTFDSFTYKDITLQNRFITAITNLLNVPIGAPSPWFTTNQVVYRGVKNIVGATPDEVKPIYSPLNWQQGSSLSHFDMNRASGETFVMHPSIGTNTERSIDNDEKDVLCHLGYRVEGVVGCETQTPVAVDDALILEDINTTVCINPLENDTIFYASGLVMNSLIPIDIQPGDLITYYSNFNCTGSLVSTADGARSIELAYTSAEIPRVISYTNKLPSSNRISFPGKIVTVPSCDSVTGPDEYICNGGFELVNPDDSLSKYLNCNTTFNPVFYWRSYFCPNAVSLAIGYLSAGSFFNVNINGNYIADINHFPWAFSNSLKQPLIAGEEYILYFDILLEYSSQNNDELIFGLNTEARLANGTSWINENPDQLIDVSSSSGTILGQTPTGGQWTRYETSFIPNQDSESLVFGSAYSKRFLDNISIRRADTPPPPTPTNKITGTTYQDLNQNSAYDSTEQKLPGIQVGLFQSGSQTPIQTTTTQDVPNQGKYTFNNLADGTYYTALMGESLYPQVTEPSVSTDPFPTYNHMYEVSLSGNQVVDERDFGVAFTTSTPILGCTDPVALNYNPSATVDDGSCIYPTLNQIKGLVYQDINENGSYDTSEPKLGGIEVALYTQASNVSPIQTVNSMSGTNEGQYIFSSIPDGTYYVALLQESPYNITEPTPTVGVISNHTHIYDIQAQGGQLYENNDFGVIPKDNRRRLDISVKKSLIDSSLSFFDRYVTWRVIVKNLGQASATNINVRDTIPQGLTVTSAVVSNPGQGQTFNLSTGDFLIPQLGVNQIAVVDITTRVPNSNKVCGTKTNTANLISVDQNDINTVNNHALVNLELPPCAVTVPLGERVR